MPVFRLVELDEETVQRLFHILMYFLWYICSLYSLLIVLRVARSSPCKIQMDFREVKHTQLSEIRLQKFASEGSLCVHMCFSCLLQASDFLDSRVN